MQEREYDVVVIGGLGHVGLPLGLMFANEGLKVCLQDINKETAKQVQSGEMPFVEYGAEPILKEVLANGNLSISMDVSVISKAKHIILTIGTPVDEYLNPNVKSFFKVFESLKPYLDNEQILIIRSTIYPRTTQQIVNFLGDEKGPWHIAYCPERIVQGYSVKELKELPQIVAGVTDQAVKGAVDLFSKLSPQIIETKIEEAELAKLFSNAWRYIQFAVTNQFYMISDEFGVDYDNVRDAMVEGYGRAASLPRAGFAAGPCLFKDTMQLAAFNGNNFLLGQAAVMINEGLPNFIVENLRRKYDLKKTKVGILGMTFKADIDDIRDALSYKLGKILRFHGAKVRYSDEYAKDPTFITKENLIKECDVVIVGVPHSAYKGIAIDDSKEVIDLWGVTKEEAS